jgi:hypothetical protein
MPGPDEVIYSATVPALANVAFVPLGPGLWRAHRSSSVIGTGMQKPGQFDHGELTELSVTGAQELVAVAESKEPPTLAVPLVSLIDVERHGAGAAVGSGAGSKTTPSLAIVAAAAVRPGPVGAPVSSTSGPPPPPTRVNVNFGQTFNVESKVDELMVIDPVEAL